MRDQPSNVFGAMSEHLAKNAYLSRPTFVVEHHANANRITGDFHDTLCWQEKYTLRKRLYGDKPSLRRASRHGSKRHLRRSDRNCFSSIKPFLLLCAKLLFWFLNT